MRSLTSRTILYITLGVLLALASIAQAADRFDPAARAEMIAPFVEEETVAVIHVDLARVDFEAVFRHVVDQVPIFGSELERAMRRVEQVLRSLRGAGVKDFYGVLSMGGARPDDMMFAVVPLGPEADLMKLMGPDKSEHYTQMTKDGRHYLVAASKATSRRLRNIKPDSRPELEWAFEAARDTTFQALLLPPKHTARTLDEMMPELPEQLGGGSSSVFTKGCLWAAVGIDLPPDVTVQGVVQSADPQAAGALAAKLRELVHLAAAHPPIKRDLPNIKELLEAFEPRVHRDRLVWTFDEQNQAIVRLLTLLTPTIKQARENARKAAAINQLRQIGIAMHNYHDKHKSFPASASYDENGRPLLSWRVHILPWLDQGELYREFHLDEPWDSPHNKKLIAKMPAVYRSDLDNVKPGMTTYLVPVGPGTLFEGTEPRRIRDMVDGTSNTIFTVEVDAEHAVPWTKPADWSNDPDDPLAGLLGGDRPGFCAGLADGSVRYVRASVDPKLFGRVLTHAGREPVNEFFEY